MVPVSIPAPGFATDRHCLLGRRMECRGGSQSDDCLDPAARNGQSSDLACSECMGRTTSYVVRSLHRPQSDDSFVAVPVETHSDASYNSDKLHSVHQSPCACDYSVLTLLYPLSPPSPFGQVGQAYLFQRGHVLRSCRNVARAVVIRWGLVSRS